MPCFKRPIAAAVIAAFCVCAHAQENQGSMFKDPPSIADTPKAGSSKTNSAMQVRRRADGSLALEGKIHGGGGVMTNIIVPEIKYGVRIDGPAGVDENGKPITWRQKFDKAMGHALTFKGLQAQGYKYEEFRKKKEAEGLVTQLDMWEAKNKQTKEYIEKHGPITTETFILPGSNPELSALLESPEVGVRMENGKRVYYYKGKRIDPYVKKTKPTVRKGRPITTQKTRLSVTPKKEVKDPAVTKIQTEPPKKKLQVDPSEDLRRRPTDVFVDPSTLPTIQDIESLFSSTWRDTQDSEKEPVETKQSPKKAGKTTGMISLETLFGFALGIRTAQAAENAASPSLQASSVQADDEINRFVEEIRKQNDKIVEEIQKKNFKRPEDKGEDKQTPKSFLESATASGFDPTEFAAEVVNKSRSLTPQQFEEDVRAITGAISSSDSPSSAVNALADMLESNPEIYSAIPDADLRLQQLQGKLVEVTPPDPNGEATYIFVSYSLGEDVLKDIMQRHKGRSDVTLVMRGVPQGTKIHEGIQKMQKLASEVTPAVSVIIDPGLFKQYDIRHVPSVARVGRAPSPLAAINKTENPSRKYAPLIAKVAGLHNDTWLMEEVKAGQRGDLGVQGHLVEIAEPDLIEEMKKRVALIDWDKKKREAVKRFWKTREFKVFPTAQNERVREIDPTILVEKDLKDLAGRYIRKAGERVNPLRIRPFTQTILIFNPLSKDEMQRVEAFLTRQKEQGLRMPVMIATQIDKSKDWDGYTALTDRLDAHVFLMTPEVEYQWRIEKTPSVVTADNKRHVFLVRELGPVDEKLGERK